jgi:hypothetical protein
VTIQSPAKNQSVNEDTTPVAITISTNRAQFILPDRAQTYTVLGS